jgi:hypothetical protein
MKKERYAMKRDKKRMCLHLYANIDDSRNMFVGYYGRRRLKTTLALLAAVLILLTLIHQNGGKILIIFTAVKFWF